MDWLEDGVAVRQPETSVTKERNAQIRRVDTSGTEPPQSRSTQALALQRLSAPNDDLRDHSAQEA